MRWKLYWTLVFTLNLIVPFGFATAIVSGWSWVGVAVAVIALWVAGLNLCGKNPTIIRRLVFGGIPVGLSQFYPMLHIFAGALAFGITGFFGCIDTVEFLEKINGPVGGFIATVVTGGFLMAVAFVFGCAKEWFDNRSRRHSKRAPVVKPLFDREMDG